jgi:hypothetical protein
LFAQKTYINDNTASHPKTLSVSAKTKKSVKPIEGASDLFT